MKLLKTVVMFMAIIVSPLILFGGSCESKSPYYIQFTLDGEEYVFEQGLTDVDDNAFGHIFFSTTWIYAALEKGQDTSSLPQDYIIIRCGSTTTGTYPWGIDSLLFFRYDRNGEVFFPDMGGTTTATIDKYGEVGDTIEGTFTAYLADQDTGTTILQLTNGTFKVKRLEDDSVAWP